MDRHRTTRRPLSLLAAAALTVTALAVTSTPVGADTTGEFLVGIDQAYDMNNAGEVAGVRRDGGRPIAIRWTEADGAQPIPGMHPDGGLATGINDAGVVVGRTSDGRDAVGFRWTETDGTQFLGDLGGPGTWVNAVDEDGVIVGETHVANSALSAAFRWTEADGMEQLVNPYGLSAIAHDISGGVTVGEATVAILATRPVRWTETGQMKVLTDANGSAYATDGELVVGEWVSEGLRRPFVWSEADGIRSIGDKVGRATAVVDGTVLGWIAIDGQEGDLVPFRWTESGGLEYLDLPDSAWSIRPSDSARLHVYSTAMNAAGTVLLNFERIQIGTGLGNISLGVWRMGAASDGPAPTDPEVTTTTDPDPSVPTSDTPTIEPPAPPGPDRTGTGEAGETVIGESRPGTSHDASASPATAVRAEADYTG